MLKRLKRNINPSFKCSWLFGLLRRGLVRERNSFLISMWPDGSGTQEQLARLAFMLFSPSMEKLYNFCF